MPALTVEENIALPLILAATPDGEWRSRAAERSPPSGWTISRKTSGGIVWGAGSTSRGRPGVAQRPRLVLADEPTGQLDRANGQHLMEVLLSTTAQTRAAVVVSTHDRAVAHGLETHRYMDEGRLHLLRRPDSFMIITWLGGLLRRRLVDCWLSRPVSPLPSRSSRHWARS